jgi:hypothetical protein
MIRPCARPSSLGLLALLFRVDARGQPSAHPAADDHAVPDGHLCPRNRGGGRAERVRRIRGAVALLDRHAARAGRIGRAGGQISAHAVCRRVARGSCTGIGRGERSGADPFGRGLPRPDGSAPRSNRHRSRDQDHAARADRCVGGRSGRGSLGAGKSARDGRAAHLLGARRRFVPLPHDDGCRSDTRSVSAAARRERRKKLPWSYPPATASSPSVFPYGVMRAARSWSRCSTRRDHVPRRGST